MLQEAILTIPRGITRLMDMLMDREVQNVFMESCFWYFFSMLFYKGIFLNKAFSSDLIW